MQFISDYSSHCMVQVTIPEPPDEDHDFSSKVGIGLRVAVPMALVVLRSMN